MLTALALASAVAFAVLKEDTIPEVLRSARPTSSLHRVQAEVIAISPVEELSTPPAAHAQAGAKIRKLLQSGQTEDDCKTLADTTIADVSGSISTAQGMLDTLDKGEHCTALGEDEVQVAREELTERKSEAETAQTELDAATQAQVQLQPRQFSLLTTGDCNWIKEDPGYQTALETYNAAVDKAKQAKVAVTAAEKYFADMIAEAERLEHECECTTQKIHAAEWNKANENNEENQKAWTQAHHMLCVLAHTTYENCEVEQIPELSQPNLADGVKEAVCDVEHPPTASPGFEHPPPTASPGSEHPPTLSIPRLKNSLEYCLSCISRSLGQLQQKHAACCTKNVSCYIPEQAANELVDLGRQAERIAEELGGSRQGARC